MVVASLFLLEVVALVEGLAAPHPPPPPPSSNKMDPSSRRRTFLTGIMIASSTGANLFLVNSPAQAAYAAAAAAYAYEARVIGSEKPSATMAAYNLQIQETTARLEKDGFPLDSRQDEAKRLSEAMASFSYSDYNSSSSSSSSSKKATKSSSLSRRNNNKMQSSDDTK